MKMVFKILFWVVILGYLVVVPGFVSYRADDVPCSSIEIDLPDSLSLRFITKDMLVNSINKREDPILGYPTGSLNTREVESQLALHPALKKVEAYKTAGGKLHIEAIQRKPVVRIIDNTGMSYYLDDEGAVIPFSDRFTPRTLIASGYIRGNEKIRQELSIRNTSENSILREVHEISCFITSSDFWKAQIEQIYVTKDGEFELVPKVGAHRIILGSFDDYQMKFRKLYTLFDKALNNVGWNKYEIINLKFDRQVVCTRRTYY